VFDGKHLFHVLRSEVRLLPLSAPKREATRLEKTQRNTTPLKYKVLLETVLPLKLIFVWFSRIAKVAKFNSWLAFV
jgi:hypothetical protein